MIPMELQASIRAARWRLRAICAIRWASRFLAASAAVAIVWIILARLGLVPDVAVRALIFVGASGIASALAIAFGIPLPAFEIARITDLRGRTGDRLASAVEFLSLGRQDPLVQCQANDAAAQAAILDLRTLYPLALPREGLAAILLTIVAVAALLVPNVPLFWSAQRKQEAAEVRKEGVRIEHVSRDAQRAAERNRLEETRKAAMEARALAEAMKRGNLTKKQALIALQKLTDRLARRQDAIANANAANSQSLRNAADRIARSPAWRQKDAGAANVATPNRGDAQAQRIAQQLLQALRSGDAQAQNLALQRMANLVENGALSAGTLARLQRQLAEMGRVLNDTALRELAKQLSDIARLLERTALDKSTLRRIAAMMRQAGGT